MTAKFCKNRRDGGDDDGAGWQFRSSNMSAFFPWSFLSLPPLSSVSFSLFRFFSRESLTGRGPPVAGEMREGEEDA